MNSSELFDDPLFVELCERINAVVYAADRSDREKLDALRDLRATYSQMDAPAALKAVNLLQFDIDVLNGKRRGIEPVTDEWPVSGETSELQEVAIMDDPINDRDPLPEASSVHVARETAAILRQYVDEGVVTATYAQALHENNDTLDQYVAQGVITQFQSFILWFWGAETIALAGPKGDTVPDASHTKYKRNTALIARYVRKRADDPVWQRLLGKDIEKVKRINSRRLIKYVLEAQAAIEESKQLVKKL